MERTGSPKTVRRRRDNGLLLLRMAVLVASPVAAQEKLQAQIGATTSGRAALPAEGSPPKALAITLSISGVSDAVLR